VGHNDYYNWNHFTKSGPKWLHGDYAIGMVEWGKDVVKLFHMIGSIDLG